ncbi:hypothetical protein [Gordonia hydrophobica]|uniref:Uncharacterized protein n=1 Tax=Gordonia hydrophobica TaxID=40516 RepID=A0ABZ2TW97_9ACTN|nr:hypothetical protein [Gordonia hydrophobica]MBM7365910.1 hypothetical protein [Gordonia hydrophobica]
MEQMNRAQRRAQARAQGGRRQRLKRGLVSVGAVVALGSGTVLAPAGQVLAQTASSVDLGSMDLAAVVDMLDEPIVKQFVEMCRTGALATGPDADRSTEYDPDNPPLAIADCTTSNGTGIALVLPESLEVGQAAEGITMDLGDDINLLFVKYRMGERNLLEVLGGAVLGSDTVKSLADAVVGVRVDPGAFDKYDTYAAIQQDAALPVVMERYCTGFMAFGRCIGEWRDRDKNYDKRSEALKMAEFLTGHTYDHTVPQQLPSPAKPIGTSVIAGDGVNVALSMRGGNALAQTGHALALALAAADKGRTSTAFADLGIASAVNIDTDDVTFTWFGQEIDFAKLRATGVLDSDLAGDAGADAGAMLDLVEGLKLPGLKEVSCFGLNTTATAEGLGTCTNYLGTFDYYKDLRPVTDGGHRQEQYGLADVTSLFFGNDALLKQLGPVLGGDTSGLMDSPFMADMLNALVSEEQRIKFAKDFVRYTKDVHTVFAKEPVLDEDGNPVLDDDGNPVMTVKQTPRMVGATEVVDGAVVPLMVWVDADGNEVPEGTADARHVQRTVQATADDGTLLFDPVIEKTTTAHWLTSDYGLREPLVIQWLGHEIVFFPAVEINGALRPNLIGLPQIRQITGDAQTGLLPKISLVQWDNPFGLGTLSLDNPFDPVGTVSDYLKTVTIIDDLTTAGELIGQLSSGPATIASDAGADRPESDDTVSDAGASSADVPPMIVGTSVPDLPSMVVNEPGEPAPIEVVTPDVPTVEEQPTSDVPIVEEPGVDVDGDDSDADVTGLGETPVDSASEPALEPVG